MWLVWKVCLSWTRVTDKESHFDNLIFDDLTPLDSTQEKPITPKRTEYCSILSPVCLRFFLLEPQKERRLLTMLNQAIDRACSCLFISVISLSLYRYTTSLDRYKCGALLEGRWIEPAKQWQPPGCMLHRYKSNDLTACLQGKLAFIGDSTVREVFWATAEKLDATGTNQAMYAAEKHSDISFSRGGVQLEFIWDPYLNSSNLDHHLESHSSGMSQGDNAAAIVLVGGGLWYARDLGDVSTKEFGSAMDRIMAHARKTEEKVVLFANSFNARLNLDESLLAIAPVRVPHYRSLSPDRAATLTQDKINQMNDYLQHLSTDHGAPVVWSYFTMTWEQALAFQKDGLHLVNSVATLQADILLNMRCNAQLSRHGAYPMEKTCCSTYTRPNWVQRAVLMSSIGILPLVSAIAAKGRPIHIFRYKNQANRLLRAPSPYVLPLEESVICIYDASICNLLLLLC